MIGKKIKQKPNKAWYTLKPKFWKVLNEKNFAT